MKNYQKLSVENDQQLRLLLHDWHNHMVCIKGLAMMENLEGIKSYIDKIDQQMCQFHCRQYTGCTIADILLSEKIAKAQNANVEFEFYGDGSDLDFIEGFDLCVILGNLLDNALESSLDSVDKSISLDIYANDLEELIILIQNSCDHEPHIENGQLLTTKADSTHHGLGLINVQNVLRKYHAQFEFNYYDQEKTFETKIVFQKIDES